MSVGSGRAAGTFTLAGSGHAFTAPLARRPAGLYRGEKTAHGKHFLGGWIVLPDHRQRGAVKAGSNIVARPTLGFTNPLPTLAVSVPSAGTITVGSSTRSSTFERRRDRALADQPLEPEQQRPA